MFPSVESLKRLDARELFDFTFLSLVSLSILQNDFKLSPDIKKYAFLTHYNGNWDRITFHARDLAVALHTCFGDNSTKTILQDQEQTKVLFDKLNVNTRYIEKFLKNIVSGNNKELQRHLLHFERGFDIQNSHYRSVRRLAQDWNILTTHEKELVVTKLLQFFRAKAPRSEIKIYLEHFAKYNKLELKNVNNDEQ